MDQFYFTAPMMRCGLDNSNCFRRANQESSAIFQRLTALPEWKRQQCDLVLQVEGAAANADQKIFEVVELMDMFDIYPSEEDALK